MRRAVPGSLICIILLAGAPAVAGDAPTNAAGADTTHTDPTHVNPGKKPVKPTKTRAAPLSAAAAYEATRANLPAAPVHARTPSAAASDSDSIWTGFHIGGEISITR